MELLQGFLGDPQKQQGMNNFVQKYNEGHPSQGYSDDEVVQHFQQVAPHMSGSQMQNSAEQSFERLSPEERQQFAQWLRQRAKQKNVQLHPKYQQANPQQDQNPGFLAEMLGSMTGGGAAGAGGGSTASTLMGLLGGGAGGAAGGGSSGMFGNPLAKAAMAGITAMAAKKLMGK
jgi:hypothetical protein